MTVNAITDTKKGRTGIAPTYLHTTQSTELGRSYSPPKLAHFFWTTVYILFNTISSGRPLCLILSIFIIVTMSDPINLIFTFNMSEKSQSTLST